MASTKNVNQLQEAVNNFLNSKEQAEFVRTLSGYRSGGTIHEFAYSLKILLDTPAKRHLATLLRRVIPKQDLPVYDQLKRLGRNERQQRMPASNSNMSNGLRNRSLSRSTGNLYKTSSTMSMPATLTKQHYGTLPARTVNTVIRRQQSVPQDLNKIHNGGPGASTWESCVVAPRTKRIHLEQPSNHKESLGFSIRGGAEHGIGIYVSYVDVDSLAERHRLVPGDQILSVNGVPFQKIFHEEAAKV